MAVNVAVFYIIFQICWYRLTVGFIAPDLQLLVANGTAVNTINIEDQDLNKIVGNQTRANAIDYHTIKNYIYWTDTTARTISRIHYPSRQTSPVDVIKETNEPSGIAVDPVDDHVYWIEYQLNGKIKRCNLDGSNETLILKLTPFINYAIGLALDAKRRWLYFSGDKIEKTKMDGSETQLVFQEKSSYIMCLAIDSPAGRLYWTDFFLGGMKSSKLDGTDVSVIIKSKPKSLHAIDVFGEFLYYSDITTKNISKLNKITGAEPIPISSNIFGLGIRICKLESQITYT